MSDSDDEEWTLEDLQFGEHELDRLPNANVTRRLVNEYHAMFVPHGGVGASSILSFLRARFDLDMDHFDADSWKEFRLQLTKEHFRIGTLTRCLRHNGLNVGPERVKLNDAARVVYNANEFVVHCGRFLANTNPASVESRNYLPPEVREPDVYALQVANVAEFKEEKNNNFQNAFLYFAQVLECLEYRRASGRFFKRVVTPAGYETLAFAECMTIAEFVGHHTTHSVNFKAFKWASDPASNYDRLIEALKNRPLPEAPDLKEDLDLRSFAGDAFGRGAGIYDSSCDMFWPYAMRSSWAAMAEHVTTVRRRAAPAFVCSPPEATATCVIHIDAAFPYDIYEETMRLGALPVGAVWRNAYPFECARAHALRRAGAESSEEDEGGGAQEKLLALLASALPEIEEDAGADEMGRSWLRLPGDAPASFRDVSTPRLAALLDAGTEIVYLTDADHDASWSGECCATASDGTTYIAMRTPAYRRRARVPSALARAFSYAPRTFAKTADGRHFRVDTGRTWRDCDAEEIEHIYRCQKFGAHDQFFLFGLKGRLFFPVGRFDKHEMSVFFQGIGGCGKSTVIKAHQPFWPSHLKGNLSSNMQATFGMSQFVKCAVIFCNEVGSDLQVNQEEWQTSVSGEWGSYNRKFQDPIECQWQGQHFWVGNQSPLKKFNNEQGQVSRRLAGVMMSHPVMPRDGKILEKIHSKLGSLLRKDILAYHEFVAVTGNTDPMSEPERLPPAFADFYRMGKRATNPVEDFLSEGTFVKPEAGALMLMSTFRELYSDYRHHYDMGKALRWDPSCYQNVFAEKGITVYRPAEVTIDEKVHNNVDVICGVAAVPRQM